MFVGDSGDSGDFVEVFMESSENSSRKESSYAEVRDSGQIIT